MKVEVRVDKMTKLCNSMVEAGKSYISQQGQVLYLHCAMLLHSLQCCPDQFMAGLWEMSSYFAADQETETTATLNKLIHSLQVLSTASFSDMYTVYTVHTSNTILQEVTKFQNILVDQASRAVSKAGHTNGNYEKRQPCSNSVSGLL